MGLFDFIKQKQSLAESGVLKGMTDRHCHVLFGVDDGIRTLEDATFRKRLLLLYEVKQSH